MDAGQINNTHEEIKSQKVRYSSSGPLMDESKFEIGNSHETLQIYCNGNVIRFSTGMNWLDMSEGVTLNKEESLDLVMKLLQFIKDGTVGPGV